MDRKAKGKTGEELAVKYLQNRGVEIIERNYRYDHGEIDLIGLIDNQLLVFYEVKLRTNMAYGYPEAFVTDQQQEKIRSTAEDYMYQINWNGAIRFDIVAIDGRTGELELFEDAF